MTTIQHAAPAVRSGPTVHRADTAPNRRRGGDIRVLLSPTSVGATAGFMGTLTLEPGEVVTEHWHPYSEEYLYCVSGEVSVDRMISPRVFFMMDAASPGMASEM